MVRPKLRALLIDLSGTLHIGDQATPGAAEALRRARDAGLAIRFCSNTSKESTADLKSRLTKIGFAVNDGELWTSLGALKNVLETRKLKRPYFLLSVSATAEFLEYDNSLDAHYTEYDSVVVGLAPELFDYAHLTQAFRILSHLMQQQTQTNGASASAASPLITTHRAKYIRTPDGELSLGPGPFITALEDAVGRGLRAESVGKPGRTFFERVLNSLGDEFSVTDNEGKGGNEGDSGNARRWEGIALVGDDIEADLGGAAAEVGLWRVLVKTGKYQQGDETRPGLRPPDEIQDSFALFMGDLVRK